MRSSNPLTPSVRSTSTKASTGKSSKKTVKVRKSSSLIAPTSTSTREILLDRAEVLIQERGWTSFSFQDLADAVGIRKASIHYHFPSKEALGVASLARWHERLHALWDGWEKQHAAAPARLQAVITYVEQLTSGSQRVCPVGNLQSHFAVLPPSMQQSVMRLSEDHVARLSAWLDQGRRDKTIDFPGKPRDQACVFQSVVQAAAQRARTNPREPFATVAKQLMRLMRPRS